MTYETTRYAELPYPRAVGTELRVVQVDHEDAARLDDGRAISCRFFARHRAALPMPWGGSQVVESPPQYAGGTVFFGGAVLSAEELAQEAADRPWMLDNLRAQGAERVVRCRDGGLRVFHDGDRCG